MNDKAGLIIEQMKTAGKPVKTGELADLVGMPKNLVAKIIKKLKNDGKIISPKRCFYAISEE